MENLVQKALDDLESISSKIPEASESFHSVRGLKWLLGCIQMLNFCGRKWSEDVGWKSIVCTLEETIHILSLEILFLCLTLKEDVIADQPTFHYRWDHVFYKCHGRIIKSTKPGTHELYGMLSDLTLRTSSCSRIDVKQQLDNIDCINYNLQSLHHPLQHEVKALRFMKNFILFAMHHGLLHRQMRNLFTHVDAVLIRAAFLVLQVSTFSTNYFTHLREQKMMTNIEPVESGVCEIYVGVLQEVLKSPGSSNHLAQESHTLIDISADFVDSLIFVLLNLFFDGSTVFIDIFGIQMQKLHEGLTFLRTTLLKKHHDKADDLHKKMHDIVKPSICEAGIIIFSLFQENEDKERLVKKLELSFSDFEEIIKLIQATEEKRPRYSVTAAYPQTNLLGFIDFVLQKMKSFMLHKAGSVVALEKDKLQSIYGDLRLTRAFLVHDIGQPDNYGKIKDLWSCAAAVAYETEFILDSLVAGKLLQSLVVLLDVVIAKIELIKTKVFQSSQSMEKTDEGQDISKAELKMPSIGTILYFNENVVGLDDETNIIINRLTRGTKHLDVISIVGMAGLGKTTLAKKLYYHFSITHHFTIRSWCTISQVYSKKNVLLEILSGVDKNITSVCSERNEDDLANILYKRLKGRKYLIILDDVWDTQVWSSVKISFPDDAKGSRILLTSRQEKVALQIKPNSKPHRLRTLTDDESLKLFQMKIRFEEGCHFDLLARGKAIAQHCKGLPLMILIVAGFLSNTASVRWKEVEEILNKGSAIAANQCKETLELSYRHLPDHLKPCFLYFGSFKEDQQILVRELSWLWIAEGFVEETGRECLEDIAKGYLRELLERNLVMIAKRGSRGEVKSCVLHDLLHDFAIARSKEEHFMHHVRGHELNIPIEPSTLYRLTYGSRGVEEFAELRLFLAFTAACTTSIIIPPTIANLTDLETFIVKYAHEVLLPDTIWIMKKLKHLEGAYNWTLPSWITDPVFNLENLMTLKCVVISRGQTMMGVLKKLPNLRRLKCAFDMYGDHNVDFTTSSQLESLTISGLIITAEFQFPKKLKKLTLRFCGLPWSEISLPNLEALFLDESFMKENWDMEGEGTFPKLKFMKMRGMKLVRWTGLDDNIPSLETLVLEDCSQLEELPFCLAESSSLQRIEVTGCPRVINSIKIIYEMQMDLGNEDMIRIYLDGHQLTKENYEEMLNKYISKES